MLWGLWTSLKAIATSIPVGIAEQRETFLLEYNQPQVPGTFISRCIFLFDSLFTGTEYVLCLQKCPSQTDRENYCLLCNGEQKDSTLLLQMGKKIILWEKQKESKSFGILIIHLTVS